MWKTVVAGAAALAIAGTSLVYAQQRDDGPPRAHHRSGSAHAPQLSQEDRAAFTDARIAALKAGLRLSPEQERNWPAFETALREIAKTRVDARQDRREARRGERRGADRNVDPVIGMRAEAERLSTAGANLKRLADAQEPLYGSLDDSQKKRFTLLSRVLTSDRAHFAQMRKEMRRHHRHEMRGEGRPHHERGDDHRGQRSPGGEPRGPASNGMGERL